MEVWHVVAVCAGGGVLLLLILLPMSFSDLQYYEYGFLHRKSTGSVDISKVYGPGERHCIGPDMQFKKYKSDAHMISLPRITVFTSDKLEVIMSADFQYFLKRDELPLLHRQYDVYYEPILKTNAQDALKGAATVFSKNEFIENRRHIESAMFKAVRERLGGKCCVKGCNERGNCVPGCTSQQNCKTSQRGLFAEVRYFQLRDVDIPADVEENYLKALVEQEEADRETYLQQYKIVQKKTDSEVKVIENEATEIAQNATAQAGLIRSKATAEASAMIEKARSDGLRQLYSKLGLTSPEHKSTFDYLRTLKNMANAHLTVDYDQIIAGSLK